MWNSVNNRNSRCEMVTYYYPNSCIPKNICPIITSSSTTSSSSTSTTSSTTTTIYPCSCITFINFSAVTGNISWDLCDGTPNPETVNAFTAKSVCGSNPSSSTQGVIWNFGNACFSVGGGDYECITTTTTTTAPPIACKCYRVELTGGLLIGGEYIACDGTSTIISVSRPTNKDPFPPPIYICAQEGSVVITADPGNTYDLSGGTNVCTVDGDCQPTTTTTTTINLCACITFTNLRNDPTYVLWDVCPGYMIIGGGNIPGGIGQTLKACGSNPRSDTPGAASWIIGSSCDKSQPFPACSQCLCSKIIVTSSGGGHCDVTYYNCYGEFVEETLSAGTYDRCIQDGSFNSVCIEATCSITPGGSCTSDYDCIPCHCYEVTPDVGTCIVERTACDGSFESSSVSVGTGLVKFCAQVGSVNIIPLAPGDSATVVDTNNDCTVSRDCN